MGRAASIFKQTDVMRAVKGVQAAGLDVGAVEISPDGTICVKVAGDNNTEEPASPFDQWKAKRDASADEGN